MFVLVSIRNTKMGYVAVHIIFVCVSLAIHDVNTGLLRADNCGELVDSLPELRPRKYERYIISVLLYTYNRRSIMWGRYIRVHPLILDDGNSEICC
jgi:hypothetical protein